MYGGRSYGFFVHVPEGLTAEQARGLPLVFSVHGRGEPAWMFAEKNGWDRLADETGAFLLAVPELSGKHLVSGTQTAVYSPG